MRIDARVVIIALTLVLAAAHDEMQAQARYRGTVVEHGGTVKGMVRLTSLPGGEYSDRVTKDEPVCGRRKPSPRLLAGKEGGVRFAVVWIDGIVQGKKCSPPGMATLRQRKCEYNPHVLLLNPDDELEIVNEDPILHNVHSYDMDKNLRSVFNIAQPVRGFHTRVRTADLAGISALMTTCDAGHPWMSAYVIRASSPYCVITDAEGKFQIGDIPPGTYTLKMWHEGIAARNSTGGPGTPPVVEEPYLESRQITVKSDETLTVGFDFSLRPAVASN
ncbi:MAG TPA: hypothetical protein VK569_00090 [Bacteroidota bacterium]|nr:hypothetical protein [Bacteroidota bacterium]